MELRKNSIRMEQLLQIAKSPVWDGDLISKEATDELSKKGFISRQRGFSFPTDMAIIFLDDMGFIKR